MNNLPPFRYYTDGENEYRIERCPDDSGAVLFAPGKHGRTAAYAGKPGHRMWKLCDRPVAPLRIEIVNYCVHDPQCSHDGSARIKGQYVPPANRWEQGAYVLLPNAADWSEAEIKLLGADLLAECERVDGEAAAVKRMQTNATDTTVAVRVDLGRSYLRDNDR